MKILTPINSLELMPYLAEAGADEFYMGFYEPEWFETFGKYSDLNRMSSYGSGANSSRLRDVENFVKTAHKHGCSLYITMNSASYDDRQLEMLGRYMEALRDMEADGVIVSGPEQVLLAAEKGIPAICSTMCSIYNQDIARYYASLGVRRMILPRELSAREVESIMKAVPDAEYEVFFMRNGCRYSDSYCLGMHGGSCGGLCYDQSFSEPELHLLENNPDKNEEKANRLRYNNYLYKDLFHAAACAQCAVWRFLRAGVSALKVVGRVDDPDQVLKDVSITRENIKTAQDCATEAEYLSRMVIPGGSLAYCAGGMSCYYPEIRF